MKRAFWKERKLKGQFGKETNGTNQHWKGTLWKMFMLERRIVKGQLCRGKTEKNVIMERNNLKKGCSKKTNLKMGNVGKEESEKEQFRSRQI